MRNIVCNIFKADTDSDKNHDKLTTPSIHVWMYLNKLMTKALAQQVFSEGKSFSDISMVSSCTHIIYLCNVQVRFFYAGPTAEIKGKQHNSIFIIKIMLKMRKLIKSCPFR